VDVVRLILGRRDRRHAHPDAFLDEATWLTGCPRRSGPSGGAAGTLGPVGPVPPVDPVLLLLLSLRSVASPLRPRFSHVIGVSFCRQFRRAPTGAAKRTLRPAADGSRRDLGRVASVAHRSLRSFLAVAVRSQHASDPSGLHHQSRGAVDTRGRPAIHGV
jgi:hypothetical protein